MEINCASLPETLLETELFGHEKGAFTDAKELKKGLLETGKSGTVFLDEIGDMPFLMQAKILQVCENKKIRRIGSTRDIEINVRLIAATNKDLSNMVREGSFREDLYYRLKVMHIHLPPLRERREDIPLLVNHFIDYYNKEYRARKDGITKEAMEYLLAYGWPGNVRELKNLIERAILLNKESYLKVEDLPYEILSSLNGSKENEILNLINLSLPQEGISLELLEKEMIRKALEMSGGNQSKAARMLRISRDALRYRMDKFNLNKR
jgi:transcriptional regulator with PAS, ATPase and Fis domain